VGERGDVGLISVATETSAGESEFTRHQLILVRHAPSSLVRTGWLTSDGFRAWRAEYERAGILDTAGPPEPLAQSITRDTVVIASDAPRALLTARRLAPRHRAIVSPLLRELQLDAPQLDGWSLPLTAWAIVVGWHTWRLTRRGEWPPAGERTRIQDAVAWLLPHTVAHRRVVVVTHAVFRSRLAAALREEGWSLQAGVRSVRPWSAWTLERDGG
jgi:broad specificity phosphatase PhoE